MRVSSSKVQYETLYLIRRKRGVTTTTPLNVSDVVEELCRLGAHLKNNGPPGWMLLKRVLQKLNTLAEGLSLASPDLLIVAPNDVINL